MRDGNGQATNYSESVDWFSFGCVLYELRVGVSPFRSAAANKFAVKWLANNKKPNNHGTTPASGSGGAAAAAVAAAGTMVAPSRSDRQPQRNKIDVAVMEMEVSFSPNEIKEIGFDYVDLCQALLAKNPAERLGKRSDDITMHPW
jgi:serine/threonine protein kinase